MRKLLSIAAICLLAVTGLVLVRCSSITGGAPTNIQITMATDSTIKVTWTAPSEGTPDKYYVAFMATGSSAYTDFDTVTVTEATNDPAGKTGSYKVTAVFGSTTYDGATNPSSVPIATAATTVYELNQTGNSGYGWNQTSGAGSTYSMTSASNASLVDFYITDFATGYAGPTYDIASPDEGPTDPGGIGVVPGGSWKTCGFTNALANEADPLPTHSTTTYFNYTDLTSDPTIVGCYTDGYYALVVLSSYNVGAGTVSAQSWFQIIKGLRLIQHP